MPRIPRRFVYLANWFRAAAGGRDRPTTLMEMVQFVASPSFRARGRRHVARVEAAGHEMAVYFHGLERPLYWPRELPLDALYMVAGEQFDHDDWHQYETEETPVRRDDIVVDCGAAEGLFALRVAARCRRVYAIEPYPRFASAMRRSFEGLENVEIVECLLGERDGTGKLSGAGLTAMEGTTGADTALRSLDSLFPPGGADPTYLKADVEGAELRVLRGGRELIRRSRPRIAFTTYHDATHADEIAHLLKEIEPGYRIRTKGWSQFGTPLMLHAWIEDTIPRRRRHG